MDVRPRNNEGQRTEMRSLKKKKKAFPKRSRQTDAKWNSSRKN
jgi:hypothetical protein